MNVNTIANNIVTLPIHSQMNNLKKTNNKFVNDSINLNNSPNAIYNVMFEANVSKPLSIV